MSVTVNGKRYLVRFYNEQWSVYDVDSDTEELCDSWESARELADLYNSIEEQKKSE